MKITNQADKARIITFIQPNFPISPLPSSHMNTDQNGSSISMVKVNFKKKKKKR